ncbi:hypothetical protein NL676_008417 [Syzygium grande]|nr:hypothetical protein NL676_008417 [Syzygium grande]
MDRTKQSRVWDYETANNIIRTEERKKAIEAVYLGLQTYTSQEFSKLPNLRFLKLHAAQLDGDFENQLSELRYLSWYWCPPELLAINFHPRNLVVLNLSYSSITENWAGWSEIKEVQVDGLEQLIDFEVNEAVLLEGFVGLSSLKRLERLKLEDCPNLTAIQGLGSVESLEELEIIECPQIKSLDDLSDLKRLESLVIRGCHELQAVNGLDELEALTELGFDGCRSLRFPTSVLNWKAPDECSLSISDCPNLGESWFEDDVSEYKQRKVQEERGKKRKRSERKMRRPFSRAWALVWPEFRRNFVYRQSASTSNGKSGKKEGKKRKRDV